MIVELIGDLANVFSKNIADSINQNMAFIEGLIIKLKNEDNNEIQDTVNYATEKIKICLA